MLLSRGFGRESVFLSLPLPEAAYVLGLWPFSSVLKASNGCLDAPNIISFWPLLLPPSSTLKTFLGSIDNPRKSLDLKFRWLATLIPDLVLMVLCYVTEHIHCVHSWGHGYPCRGCYSTDHGWLILFTILVNSHFPSFIFFLPVLVRRSKRSCVSVLYNKLWSTVLR